MTSKINIFPNTIVQTNGTTPYILRTIERTGSLNHVEIESKTDETINIDLSDIIFDSVAIKGGSDLGETTLLWVRNSMNAQPWSLVENRILTCTEELKEQYTTELQFLVNKGYNIDVPVTANYLRFTAREDSVNIKSGLHGVFEYKKNGVGDWIVWSEELTLQPGEYIDVRGYGFDNEGLNEGFKMSGVGKVEASGDITSLLNGAGGDVAITKSYQFLSMFDSCSNLITPPNLPSTTLAERCYQGMFDSCFNLTTAPELPATTLNSGCYYQMFESCRKLTTAPKLPATTLANGCYYEMFRDCGFTTAPELPATTLANDCYRGMFLLCKNLTTAPKLPATTLATYCYYDMFGHCTSLTTVPELPATELTTYCYGNMFYGCSSLTTAPELLATMLAPACYSGMFHYCTNISYVKISAETPSPLNMRNWLANVAPTGTLEITNDILEVTLNNINSCPPGWNVVRSSQPPLNLTLDLNNEWRCSTYTNPEPDNYDMYESASNWHVGNSVASAYLRFEPRTTDANFIVPINSYAESSYDYAAIYAIDDEINIQEQTLNYQYDPSGAIDEFWKTTDYIIPGDNQTHFIKVIYSKDRSVDVDADRGFLLVPKGTPFINEYVE